MFQRPLSHAILLLVGFAAASPVLALGFGRIPESIPFGQPLDLTVPLRLDGGAPSPSCLQAQVRIGEQRLPPRSLQLQLEGGDEARVRIRSAIVVQEPMVEVQLTVGCNGPVSRQFIVFADPARHAAVAATEPAAAVAAPAGERRRPVSMPRTRTPPRAESARLKIEEPLAQPAAAVDEAASTSALQAAHAVQAAASAAEQRLVAVKAELEQLREETATQRALVAQMRARQAQADDPGRVQTALIAFVVSFGLVVLWLGWRMYGLRRENDGAEDDAAEAPLSEAAGPPAPTPPEPAPARPSSWMADIAPTRAAGVDELIDLEQEVEFFVLLGDEHAAVDLLGAHLRGSGAASPLPYLHLLQLHHRHEDRAAYEQLAWRFGQRFGTDAPGWEAGAGPGRELQDCAGLLAELQVHWVSPAQAMTWLERRLFSAPGSEAPGLAAYRDLLTLVAVARDLHRQTGEAESDVDLLLPLAGSEKLAASLRPSIFDMLEPAGAVQPRQAAVDLDLSEPAARP